MLGILKLAMIYGIPLLCLIMFIREMIVSYFVRAKFESTVSMNLGLISNKLKKIEDVIDHNVNRISTDIPKSSEIARLIASYRVRLNASRAYVLRFHDGAAFSTNSPVWKLSLMHESTDSNIISISEKTKDILIANIIQLVSPMFNSNDLEDGINIIKSENEIDHKVFRIDVDKINIAPIRGFLLSRGIQHVFYTPIVDIDQKPIAIFCIDYISDIPENLNDDYVNKELLNGASILSSLFV